MIYKTWSCHLGEHDNCIGGLCFCECHSANAVIQEDKELEEK